MYKLETTHQFKVDFKSLSVSDTNKVLSALKILEETGTLPRNPYLTHILKGEYKDCNEAHIKPNLLIIWFKIDKGTIKLLRVGSHSKLFRKY